MDKDYTLKYVEKEGAQLLIKKKKKNHLIILIVFFLNVIYSVKNLPHK